MADEKTQTALDAVNSALEPLTPKEETPPVDTGGEEETPPEGGEETPPEGEETPPEGGEDTPPEGEETPPKDGDKSKDGKDGKEELGPDGKPKAKEEFGPDGKPVVAKQKDPLNDPMDNRWKKETTERVQSLIGMVKERDKQLEQADTMFQAIESTGMQPEEFATMLEYARWIHSDKPADQEQAYAFLQKELRAAAIRLGKSDDIDLFDEHPDIKEAVEAGTMTEKHGRELALARTRTAESTRAAESTRTAKNAEKEYNDAVVAARQSLNTMATELMKDPNYAAKVQHLTPLIRPIFAGIHPSHWPATFKQMFLALPKDFGKAVAPAPNGEQPGSRRPAPIRPGAPAGNAAKQPSSMMEALEAGLNQAK